MKLETIMRLPSTSAIITLLAVLQLTAAQNRTLDLDALRELSNEGAKKQDYWMDDENNAFGKSTVRLAVLIGMIVVAGSCMYASVMVTRSIIDSREHKEELKRITEENERIRRLIAESEPDEFVKLNFKVDEGPSAKRWQYRDDE